MGLGDNLFLEFRAGTWDNPSGFGHGNFGFKLTGAWDMGTWGLGVGLGDNLFYGFRAASCAKVEVIIAVVPHEAVPEVSKR